MKDLVLKLVGDITRPQVEIRLMRVRLEAVSCACTSPVELERGEG